MKIFNIIVFIVTFYLVLCIGEIEVKNMRPNPQYSHFNIITNFISGGNNND